MRRNSIYCCILLTSICFSINSSAVDERLPVNQSNQQIINLCWEPGANSMRTTPRTLTGQAHCKVENVVIDVFRTAWAVLAPLNLGYSLVNAPLSGITRKNGRNLLTFSAFNGFRRLSLWGVVNGSDINLGDANRETMLGTGIYARQPYMLDFILFSLRADPNLQFHHSNVTKHPLQAVVEQRWSPDYVIKIITQGSVTRNQREFLAIQKYLILTTKANKYLYLLAKERIRWLYNSGVLLMPETASKLPPTFTDVLHEIDDRLFYSIKTNELTNEDLDAYQVHDRSFGHFLAFNGFSQALNFYVRHKLSPEMAREKVLTRDKFGYDMLLAAIHSNDKKSVAEVLNTSTMTINQKVPDFKHYENVGKKPLDLAYEWNASSDIIELLKLYGATPSVL